MKEDKRTAKPELMSPAGYWPQLKAAVAAGADAVYFGLQHFSARAKVGFELSELDEVVRYLHRHVVKGFVTFNTLVFDHELQQAASTIEAIAKAGCDAIIVQDVGIAKLAKQIAPDLDIHGSTQMSITSAQGAELAASLGCSRVVLGRELSLADMRRIAQATNVELEVFVHGALCVSYSGQCFSSEAWGGRSANRGKCAQACRLSYDLIVDGQQRELGEYRYLLSPGDLYALQQIPELVEIGIACFKIEGRYKGAEYVALTTRAYRESIDACFESDRQSQRTVSKDDLEQIYSRGLGPHFVSGVNHQSVVVGRVPRHRGLKVGVVHEVQSNAAVVDPRTEIFRGDGLVFDSATWRSPDEAEEGGSVYDVEPLQGAPDTGQSVASQLVRLQFGHGQIDFARIRRGDLVYRTNDAKLNRKAQEIASQDAPTTSLSFTVVAAVGKPLQVTARTQSGEAASFTDSEPLVAAQTNALNLETTNQQLGRLGNTPFHFELATLDSDGIVFCPVSKLNKARRELIAQLLHHREAVDPPLIHDCEPVRRTEHVQSTDLPTPQLHLLVRNAKQLDAAIELKPSSITLDYLELYGLRPSIERIKNHNIVSRVASPRILKPSEQNVVRFLLSLQCQILVRSGGLLHDLVSNYSEELPELHGDFSLNAANARSFEAYLDLGLNRIAPTHDLNATQINELTREIPATAIETVAFHHLPVFHTEHCVFCRFLSDGTDSTNCGHPCEKHEVSLRDSGGRRHAVLADVGCRNTVFGAEAQVATQQLDRWMQSGIRHFRVEFVHQTAEQVLAIGSAFQKYLAGKTKANQLERDLKNHTDQGITDGSLFVPDGFKNLIQLS